MSSLSILVFKMSNQVFAHKSVLLEETVAYVLNDLSGVYVDCTLGGGGHSLALGEKLQVGALLVGIDQDVQALEAAEKCLSSLKCRRIFVQGNFVELAKILDNLAIEKVNGIIFDLGVSSYQLDTPERGFSYMQDGPLDMRMNAQSSLTAAAVLNNYSEEKLCEIIKKYGEERWAKRIAQFIISDRQTKLFTRTFELVETIKKAIPKGARRDGPHPAKRVFQAIRIEVNKELEILEEAFDTAVKMLAPEGRIGIITFHSLEDRIAKRTLSDLAKNCICPPNMPVCACKHRAVLKNIKSIKPDEIEINENPRARSARLRTATKI